MKEAIVNFLQSITGSPWATVAVFSMFPLIELKGAIPVGEALGLILWQTALLAYVGSTLVCVPVYFLLRPVFNLLKRWKAISRLVEKIEGVFSRRAARIAEKSGKSEGKALTGMLSLGVFAFVAVPLPLTGVWTGTAIAVFLGLKFKDTILPVMLGNLAAGSVITLLTFLFSDYDEYIILGLFAIAIIMLIVFIVRIARSKPEENAGPPESGREDQ